MEYMKLDANQNTINQLPELENLTLKQQAQKIECNYYTNGIKAYSSIADDSVDVLYSCSVLQHIRKNEFDDTVKEMIRITKPGGVMYHMVDLKDMMGGSKKHLTIPEEKWEDKTHYQMWCYTNRLQCNEILQTFCDNGMKITYLKRYYFKKQPYSKNLLANEFKNISKKEFFTEKFSVALEKK